MEESLISSICEKFGIEEVTDARQVNPLSLAYVGDSIFDLVVRSVNTTAHHVKPGSLHRMTTRYVKADAQSEMMKVLEPILTEEELSIYHRGRNAKTSASAKNSSIGAYRRATGFEAVMGYLYITGQNDRLLELSKIAIDSYTPNESEGTEAHNTSGCNQNIIGEPNGK